MGEVRNHGPVRALCEGLSVTAEARFQVAVRPLDREYLTVEDVAELLRVTTTTVTRLVKQDPTVPVLRLGHRTLRFPKDRFLTWLRDREQGRPRAKRLTLSTAKPLSSNGADSA
jgi:excisionase family DNA binding protein